MKHRIIVLTMLLAVFAQPAAATSDGIGDFNAHARALFGMMTGYCRTHAVTLFAGMPQYALLNDSHAFRRACGNVLNNHPIAGTEWRFTYNEQTIGDMRTDTLGAWKAIAGGPPDMVLALGWRTSVTAPREQVERVTEEPSAVAIADRGGQWTAVWSYLDAASGRWNLPPIHSASDGSVDDGVGGRVYRGWSREIIAGFGRLVRSLRRNRGPGFPN